MVHFSSQLKNVPQDYQSGFLFGYSIIEDNDVIVCFGCCNNESNIPYGMSTVGLYYLNSELKDEEIISICQKKFKGKKYDAFVVGITSSENSKSLICRCFDLKSEKLENCNFEIVNNEELKSLCLTVNLKCRLPFSFNLSYDKAILRKNIQSSVAEAKKEIKAIKFKLTNSNLEFGSKNDKKFNQTFMIDLYNYLEDDTLDEVEVSSNMKQKMLEKMRKKKVAERTPLFFESNHNEDVDQSSVVDITEDGSLIKILLNFDLVFNLQTQENIETLTKTFALSIQRNLDSIPKILVDFVKLDEKKLYVPKLYNFYNEFIAPYFISILYPIEIEDDQLTKIRKEIHLRYLIPLDRPYVRKANCFSFETNYQYLRNVHLGLDNSGTQNSQISLVYGSYTYHHYMQDNFDDNGWGCAYRSLQTIVSWFRNQGYITKNIPSHREIQQALVDVGDKSANFVGSRQWIGSQEVCFVLGHLYKIQSKIMFVSSGAELSNKGRELEHHFTTQGTPIMIGGGVLAHTIIGVDFDQKSGNIRFLILDPHYTGSEDLKTIQKKVSTLSLEIFFLSINYYRVGVGGNNHLFGIKIHFIIFVCLNDQLSFNYYSLLIKYFTKSIHQHFLFTFFKLNLYFRLDD